MKNPRSDHDLADQIVKKLSEDTPENAAMEAQSLLQCARDAGGGALRAEYLAKAQRAIARLNPARDHGAIQKLQAEMLALQGRRGDTAVAHLTPGEIVIPKSLQTPELLRALAAAAQANGMDPAALRIGNDENSINPTTGQPEFADPLLPAAPPRYSMDHLDPLARVTYAEAGGEGPEGWNAVIGTVLNRAGSPGFPKTVPDVIFQPKAFAGTKTSKYNFDPSAFPPNHPEVKVWNGIQEMAKSRLQDAVDGKVDFAPRYFRAVGAPKSWFDPLIRDGGLVPMGTIGGHEFFEEPQFERPWPPKK